MPDPGSHQGSDALAAEIRSWQAKLDAAPPPIRCIKTHHSVPFGRSFKQWMANGDLVVWANAGEIADLPHAARPPAGLSWQPFHFGIPVVRG